MTVGPAHRGALAGAVELSQPPFGTGGAEQRVGPPERRSLRAARERLEAEQRTGVEIEDRLEDRPDQVVAEDPVEAVGRLDRRGSCVDVLVTSRMSMREQRSGDGCLRVSLGEDDARTVTRSRSLGEASVRIETAD